MPAVLYSWSLLISLRSSNSTVYPEKNEIGKTKSTSKSTFLLSIFSNSALYKSWDNSIGGILFVGNISLENFTQELRKTHSSCLPAAVPSWKQQLELSPRKLIVNCLKPRSYRSNKHFLKPSFPALFILLKVLPHNQILL